VLQPDEADLKRLMIPLFKDELLNGSSFPVVTATTERIAAHYKTQIHPREINLFYLDEGIRERITRQGDRFHVEHTSLSFSEGEMLEILEAHPERFSPNVVLRPVYQSTILPDVIFVGGGAELAYWMQLRDLFAKVERPFPVLMLRNSFLLLSERQAQKLSRIGFTIEEFFEDGRTLSDAWVAKHSSADLGLGSELKDLKALYDRLSSKSAQVDGTLLAHVEALRKKAAKGLDGLEKKLLRAEKRKYADQLRQLEALHEELFPGNGLQERVENMLPFLARYGSDIIPMLHLHSFTFEQKFNVLSGLS
jgi:bacillithiol biosynthesis cysteine-adding enzyme BshC